MPTETDAVRLQLAIAFGQGAGCMLAEASALERLLLEQNTIITSAIGNWTTSHWAFIELVRRLGQLSATRAAMGGSAVIRWVDIEASLPAVMDLCPCFGPAHRQAV
jgi:hypothetical protein